MPIQSLWRPNGKNRWAMRGSNYRPSVCIFSPGGPCPSLPIPSLAS